MTDKDFLLTFADLELSNSSKHSESTSSPYHPRIESPAYFLSPNPPADISLAEISKMRAAYYYHRGDFAVSLQHYQVALQSTNHKPSFTVILLESIARCQLHLDLLPEAKSTVTQIESLINTGDQQINLWFLQRELLKKSGDSAPLRNAIILLLHYMDGNAWLWSDLSLTVPDSLCISCQDAWKVGCLVRTSELLRRQESTDVGIASELNKKVRRDVNEKLDKFPQALVDRAKSIMCRGLCTVSDNDLSEFTYKDDNLKNNDNVKFVNDVESAQIISNFMIKWFDWVVSSQCNCKIS